MGAVTLTVESKLIDSVSHSSTNQTLFAHVLQQIEHQDYELRFSELLHFSGPALVDFAKHVLQNDAMFTLGLACRDQKSDSFSVFKRGIPRPKKAEFNRGLICKIKNDQTIFASQKALIKLFITECENKNIQLTSDETSIIESLLQARKQVEEQWLQQALQSSLLAQRLSNLQQHEVFHLFSRTGKTNMLIVLSILESSLLKRLLECIPPRVANMYLEELTVFNKVYSALEQLKALDQIQLNLNSQISYHTIESSSVQMEADRDDLDNVNVSPAQDVNHLDGVKSSPAQVGIDTVDQVGIDIADRMEIEIPIDDHQFSLLGHRFPCPGCSRQLIFQPQLGWDYCAACGLGFHFHKDLQQQTWSINQLRRKDAQPIKCIICGKKTQIEKFGACTCEDCLIELEVTPGINGYGSRVSLMQDSKNSKFSRRLSLLWSNLHQFGPLEMFILLFAVDFLCAYLFIPMIQSNGLLINTFHLVYVLLTGIIVPFKMLLNVAMAGFPVIYGLYWLYLRKVRELNVVMLIGLLVFIADLFVDNKVFGSLIYAPVMENIVFFILPAIFLLHRLKMHPNVYIAISTFFFSIAHFDFIYILYVISGGVTMSTFTSIYIKKNPVISIWLPILLHFSWNAMVTVIQMISNAS